MNYSYCHGMWITVHVTSEIDCNMPSCNESVAIYKMLRRSAWYIEATGTWHLCHLDECIIILSDGKNTMLTWGRVIVRDLPFKPLQFFCFFNSKAHFQLSSHVMDIWWLVAMLTDWKTESPYHHPSPLDTSCFCRVHFHSISCGKYTRYKKHYDCHSKLGSQSIEFVTHAQLVPHYMKSRVGYRTNQHTCLFPVYEYYSDSLYEYYI